MRHLSIAAEYLAELETQTEIAKCLGYLIPEQSDTTRLVDEVGRMLTGLRKRLQKLGIKEQ